MKTKLLIAAALLIGSFSLLAVGTTNTAYAASASKTAACNGLSQIDTTQDCGNGGNGIANIVKVVVQIISFIAGAVAVIMIIISGFNYITSGGDSNKVAAAKNTLIYAVIGIAIAVLAQVIVNVTVKTASDATKSNTNSSKTN
jgi:hypothetical protein